MKKYEAVNIEQKICSMQDIYLHNKPYPLIVIDNLWEKETINKINLEFEAFRDWSGEKHFYGAINKKHCNQIDLMPKETGELIKYLNSASFIHCLEQLTSINDLKGDRHLIGGGMHSTGKSGYLKFHVDFNWNEKIKMHRRLNLLIYTNSNWQNDWNGELWFAVKEQKTKKIKPKKKIDICFNRTVIFETNKNTWHGHPIPIDCPETVRRNSIAMYYYTEKEGNFDLHKRDNTLYGK